MSAPLFVVFYGLRYDISEHEIGALELRNDARQVAALDAGLSSFWGDISGQGYDYKLLVGHQLGA